MRLSYIAFKSFVDRVFALLALVLLSPLLLLVSLILYCYMGAPILFVQQRSGLHGRPFNLFKFRTMTLECDSHKVPLPDIYRLTPLGSWLRKTSIDELPGLINVLRGEMSLIGPRPLLTTYLPLYSSEQARRHCVRPGITGLAQIKGRNSISWEEKFRFDTWYVDHQSFLLDLWIGFTTIFKVLSSEGITPSSDISMPYFRGNVHDE